MNSRSVDTLTLMKENIQPNGCEIRRLSFLGKAMNPIQELSPQKPQPSQGTQGTKPSVIDSHSPELRTSVTVSRSATVTGVMKVRTIVGSFTLRV